MQAIKTRSPQKKIEEAKQETTQLISHHFFFFFIGKGKIKYLTKYETKKMLEQAICTCFGTTNDFILQAHQLSPHKHIPKQKELLVNKLSIKS